MDQLGTISQRVYRDGTRYIDGKYVKDLSALNRPLEQTVIIDDNADCISMQVGCWCLWVVGRGHNPSFAVDVRRAALAVAVGEGGGM